MVDVKRIILGVADIIRGEEWSPMDVDDQTTSLENTVIKIIGDYAKKNLGLKAMVSTNKDFDKIEEFLEDMFKYGERVCKYWMSEMLNCSDCIFYNLSTKW